MCGSLCHEKLQGGNLTIMELHRVNGILVESNNVNASEILTREYDYCRMKKFNSKVIKVRLCGDFDKDKLSHILKYALFCNYPNLKEIDYRNGNHPWPKEFKELRMDSAYCAIKALPKIIDSSISTLVISLCENLTDLSNISELKHLELLVLDRLERLSLLPNISANRKLRSLVIQGYQESHILQVNKSRWENLREIKVKGIILHGAIGEMLRYAVNITWHPGKYNCTFNREFFSNINPQLNVLELNDKYCVIDNKILQLQLPHDFKIVPKIKIKKYYSSKYLSITWIPDEKYCSFNKTKLLFENSTNRNYLGIQLVGIDGSSCGKNGFQLLPADVQILKKSYPNISLSSWAFICLCDNGEKVNINTTGKDFDFLLKECENTREICQRNDKIEKIFIIMSSIIFGMIVFITVILTIVWCHEAYPKYPQDQKEEFQYDMFVWIGDKKYVKKNGQGKYVNDLVEFDCHLKKCLQVLDPSEKPILVSIKYQFDFRIGTTIQENLSHFLGESKRILILYSNEFGLENMRYLRKKYPSIRNR